MTDLERWGLDWSGPSHVGAVHSPMDDGYWTPWHLADAENARLRAELHAIDLACTSVAEESALLKTENARLRAELNNIANAKRFDRKMFDDDTSFADWAQSRARHTLRSADAGTEKL